MASFLRPWPPPDSSIDFGTIQAAYKAAARQASKTGSRRSYHRSENGPGQYTLHLAG